MRLRDWWLCSPALVVLAGTLFNAPLTASASPKLIPVVVSKETDGDTIHVRMPSGHDETLRMLLIDTPEDVKPGTPVEPFSLQAAAFARKEMPVGKHIYIQEGKTGYTRDKYGRLLAYIFITQRDMYNEDVVKRGLARVAYIYPPNTDYLTTLEKDQAYAKARKLGIWSIPGYVTPTGYNLSSAASPRKKASATTSGTKRPSTDKLRVLTFTQNVYPGDEATLQVQTLPHADASIEVDYKSGPSHAKGLYTKTADSQGDVSWSWEVGTSTTPGNWPVIVTSAGKTLQIMLDVQ